MRQNVPIISLGRSAEERNQMLYSCDDDCDLTHDFSPFAVTRRRHPAANASAGT